MKWVSYFVIMENCGRFGDHDPWLYSVQSNGTCAIKIEEIEEPLIVYSKLDIKAYLPKPLIFYIFIGCYTTKIPCTHRPLFY